MIAASLLAIGFLHHITPHSSLLWHNVFQWLYYLPVVYAATHFGLRGGLVIRDQGGGVPGDIERIFEPFYTTKEHGTGLGLAVVQRIIGQHGGTIAAEHNADSGMTFFVRLPLRRTARRPEQVSSRRAYL